MGKGLRIFLTAALILGLAFFGLGIVSARDRGLSLMDIARILQRNLEELNVSPVYREFSEVHETILLDEEDSSRIVITNTFPDLHLEFGDYMHLELYGDVSSSLDQLITWERDGDTLYIDFASIFNVNPTSTGLQAVFILPRELDSLKITSISGDVSLLEVKSTEIDIEIKSGDIRLMEVEVESLRASSQSGDVELYTWASPQVFIQTESGLITAEAEGLEGTLEASSGEIYAKAGHLKGDLLLRTQSGNIHMIHGGSDFSFELRSQSGTIGVNGLPEIVEGQDAYEGTFGQPESSLKITSSSGSIEFEQDSP